MYQGGSFSFQAFGMTGLVLLGIVFDWQLNWQWDSDMIVGITLC